MPNIATWAPLCTSLFSNCFLHVPQLRNLWGKITHFLKRMERSKRSHSLADLMDRLTGHVFSVLNKSTHASELRSGKESLQMQTSIYFSTSCCVNVKQRLLAAPEQHSLRKGVVKVQIQRSTSHNFFPWYCSSIKSTLQCKNWIPLCLSAPLLVEKFRHSEMSSKGKWWIFQHFPLCSIVQAAFEKLHLL